MPLERTNGATFSELSTGYQPSEAALRHAQLSGEKKDLYHIEKGIGRRLPSGILPLKKLSARHQRIIALYLTGKYSQVKIAQAINCSVFTVNRTINDPISRKIINDFHSSVELDLKALLPLAIDAVRDGLEDNDIDVRMRAVDRFERMTGRSEEKAKDNAFSVNISFVQNVRDKFFDELREAATDAPLLEQEIRGHAAEWLSAPSDPNQSDSPSEVSDA